MTAFNGREKNTLYHLEEQPLATGGEGKVYRIKGEPDLVAKVYRWNLFSPDAMKFRSEKIACMLSEKFSSDANELCAWPRDALYDVRGLFYGYVMAYRPDAVKLSLLLSDGLREKNSYNKLLAVALNLALALRWIHSQGQVIGDLKPANILVDKKAIVTFIDTDSFHITGGDGRLFPCRAGTPEFLPPELQGRSFTATSFSQETDVWALAIIVFKLLMNNTTCFV
jgi:DNA-binding helix-hairpin-helix protein with protein kinase domain